MGCHSISDVTEHAKITLDLKIETELGDEEFEVRLLFCLERASRAWHTSHATRVSPARAGRV